MMESKSSINTLNVVEFLNSEFGDDLTKLSKLQEVLDRIETYERELEEEVNPSSLDHAHVANYGKKAEEALKNIKDLLEKQEALHSLIEDELKTAEPIKQHFEPRIKELRDTECLLNYLQWILRIEDKSSQIEETLKGGVSDQLIDIYEEIQSIWKKLKASKCKNVVEYSKKTMLYWHEILLEKFGCEFKKVFESLNWPVLSTNLSTPLNQSSEALVRFNQLFMSVYKIALPDEYTKTLDIVEGIEDPSILLPLQLMLQPLQKRFAFHFMGNKPTNRLDKPEWYLTQILTWITDHTIFLEESVQSLLDKEGLSRFNARIQIMKGLVQLAIVRFKSDLTCLIDDDRLFSHAIDEILLFSQELRNQGYPPSYPNLTQLLTEEPCFTRWRSLEHQGALEKMDKFLSTDSAWKSRYQDESDIDDMLVPESAELFVTLLLTMTERYSILGNKDCQVSFLDLQLELLDDFRLRLHQLSQCHMQETIQPSYCGIINGLYYVTTILDEWNNVPFFLQLYAYKRKRNAYEELLRESETKSAYVLRRRSTKTDNNDELLEQSVFDEIIALFEHMQNDLLNTLCERVLLDIKAKSRPYRKEKWFCLPVLDKKLIEISPSAYPMLEVINSSLLSLQELLAKPLFTKTWQRIAEELNIYLYEEVILQNSFSEGGAAQLSFDVKRNLFPIFGSYTLKPENYFKLVRDASALLNLNSAPAMLLKETLKCEDSPEAKTNALQELGVFSLSPSQALIILSQRTYSNL
ncbi:RAD50-interacting protein 1-like [Uloborus diversus]|uniref:RAD50-interacting protein 1-like n=1 Tax=Uloborus diversus TaxID=327109 RepID=UPI00240957AE|nr:RAD50-interacting protein 1-like [Uloborus diversus]